MAQTSVITVHDLLQEERIDAEYFHPLFLHLVEKLKSTNKLINLSSIASITASAFYPAATQLYESGDTPFARCVDVVNFPIISKTQLEDFVKIPSEFYRKHKNVKVLRKGDVIISKVGTPCFASLIYDIEKIALSRTVLGLKNIKVNPYYLVAFLRSKYGFYQLWREREQTIQFQLTLDRVGKVLVYDATSEEQERVAKKIKLYFDKHIDSVNLYSQAEQLLLQELGLEDFTPEWVAGYETDHDSILDIARMDAEYFQPRYTTVINAIKQGSFTTVEDVSKFVDHAGQSPYTEHGDIAVLAQKHMNNNLQIDYDSFDNYTENDLIKPREKKYILKKNDVLISSAGNPGLTTVWQGMQKVIPGSFVTIVRTDSINPLYLGLCLNSRIGKLQFERNFTGSVQQYVYPSKIRHILIPRLNKDLEERLSMMIQESFDKSIESRQLLEQAKREVEEMIESKA